MSGSNPIRTPDQRLRVFVSSTLRELAAERKAVRDAVTRLRLTPVMFESGARAHPARRVYRSYLDQSQVFVGVYRQSYGWVAPGEEVSGLEDEYVLAARLPRLIYVKTPAAEREPLLTRLLDRIEDDGGVSYRQFTSAPELQALVENDLAVLLSERFEAAGSRDGVAEEGPRASALPVPATPLVDREGEAEAITGLVLQEGARLVTLTGPGGVGKSRLAVEVGERLSSAFADGMRFADLAPVRSDDLVIAVIAAALGLQTSGGRLIDDVDGYLRHRRLLLLLDNFEQVAGAAAVVAGLLAAAPDLVVLVTSRMVLQLRGEHEFPVAELPVPAAGAGDRVPDLQQYASVRLFVERAHAAASGFELTGENAAAVADICRRLDGLPLAIELAAAKVRLLPPRALLARLDDRLRLLTGGARDLPERQRTLRNTLDWSFELLPAEEQALFARLAVFAGTFDLAAAEALMSTAPAAADPARADRVLELMDGLVGASLVRRVDRDDEPRFGLLDTIRDYALEVLRGRAEWEETRDRHAAHFLALVESARPELEGPGQLEWLDRLETEHANLGTAMSWFIDQDELEQAQRFGGATWQFWWLHGHAEEFAAYGERILAHRDRLPPEQVALGMAGTGLMRLASGDQARAGSQFEQGLALARQTGDKFGIAVAAGALGHLRTMQHQYGQAAELLDEALVLQRELGNHVAVSLAYNFLGQIPLSQGDPDRAAELFTEGLVAGRAANNRVPLLVSLYDLALSSEARGDRTGAAELLKEGLSLSAEAGDDASVAYYLQRLAALQQAPGRAVRLHAGAEALLQAAGTGWLHAYVPSPASDKDTMADLRSRIGETAFEQAREQGAAMGRKGAVDYASAE